MQYVQIYRPVFGTLRFRAAFPESIFRWRRFVFLLKQKVL